ncbi:MAG: MoxR family ATPase [Actinoplanes sp.]
MGADLADRDYFPELALASAVFLARRLQLPLFLEGDPGVGKTALAGKVAEILGVVPIRLQCYAGIDRAQALYEWDFAKQLLSMRGAGDSSSVYTAEFLITRPILRAVLDHPAVLLIDEIDRADDEFEAFLLEVLEGRTLSIPDYRTITVEEPPFVPLSPFSSRHLLLASVGVVLTSNSTREVHSAHERRCIYHWIDHPTRERKAAIIRANVPELADGALAGVIARVVAELRAMPLTRAPGVAESIAFTRAAVALGRDTVEEALGPALGVLVKQREDQELVGRAYRAGAG